MAYRIKNWKKFQHYQNKKPGARLPWIKLYSELLNDVDWHSLPPDSAKLLVMVWMVAADTDGVLPKLEQVAFRVRMSVSKVKDLLSTLSHFVEEVSINALEESFIDTRQEKEEEEEKEEEMLKRAAFESSFEKFWQSYPKKRSKGDALKAWRAIKPTSEQVSRMLTAINRAKTSEEWQKE